MFPAQFNPDPALELRYRRLQFVNGDPGKPDYSKCLVNFIQDLFGHFLEQWRRFTHLTFNNFKQANVTHRIAQLIKCLPCIIEGYFKINFKISSNKWLTGVQAMETMQDYVIQCYFQHSEPVETN